MIPVGLNALRLEVFSLLDVYQQYLNALRIGTKPRFPFLTEESISKVLELGCNVEGPDIYLHVPTQSETSQKITGERVQQFVAKYRSAFPIQTDGVVVCRENDPYLLESAFYALLKGRQWYVFIEWEQLLPSNVSSVQIFGSPNLFDHAALATITKIFSKEERGSYWMTVPFGIMTGKSLDSLLFLMYKNLYYPTDLKRETLFLNSFALNRKQYSDSYVNLVTRDECDVEKLQALLSEHRELTVFSGHGHEDCLFLGKVSIFSSRLRQPIVKDTDLPLSAYARGEVDPNVVYADKFKTKYLFANTCSGIHFANGLYPIDYAVGLDFLNGAVAGYVSTFMVKDNSQHESLLFSRLVKLEGMTLGEAVRIVNNLLMQDTADFPCYLLVGDPEATFVTAECADMAGEVERSEDGLVLRVESQGGILLSLQLKKQHEIELFDNNQFRIQEVRFGGMAFKHDLRYLFHEDKLLIYSTREMPEGSAEIILTRIPQGNFTDTFMAIDQYTRRLEHLNIMSLFEHKFKGMAEEIGNLVKSIGPLYKPSLYSLKQSEKFDKLTIRLYSDFQRLQESLTGAYLAKVDKGSWAFSESYSGEMIGVSRCFIDQSCNNCGNQLMQKELVHPVYEDLKRSLSICPRCGIVNDKPRVGFNLHMEGAESIRQGETCLKVVTFQNTSGQVQLVTCGLGVERTKLALFPFTVDESVQTCLVPPGDTHTFRFQVSIHEACSAHSYYLKAFLLANFEIACLHNILFVLPRRE